MYLVYGYYQVQARRVHWALASSNVGLRVCAFPVDPDDWPKLRTSRNATAWDTMTLSRWMIPRLDSALRRFRRTLPVPRPARIARPPEKLFQFRSDPSNPPDCTDFDSAISSMACEMQRSYYRYRYYYRIWQVWLNSQSTLLMRARYTPYMCVNIIKLN